MILSSMKLYRKTLLLMGWMVALQMVASEPADAVIAHIRSEYNKAHAAMKENARHSPDRSDMVTTLHYMVPGCGPTTETLQFFFRMKQYGEEQFVDYQLYFVTRKYNVAARKYYEEYLFDDETGMLVFVAKQDYDDNLKRVEKRLYYRDGELYKATGGTLGKYEDELAYMLGQDYRQAFNNLIRNAKE